MVSEARMTWTDPGERLISIDLFRGVVMFFLIAEATGLYELLVAPAFEGTIVHTIGLQFQHHPWNGLRLWDLGQPFFMFISGVAMFFSYTRRWEEGERWRDSLLHALRRSLDFVHSGVGDLSHRPGGGQFPCGLLVRYAPSTRVRKPGRLPDPEAVHHNATLGFIRASRTDRARLSAVGPLGTGPAVSSPAIISALLSTGSSLGSVSPENWVSFQHGAVNRLRDLGSPRRAIAEGSGPRGAESPDDGRR